MSELNSEILRALGRIEGKLETLERQNVMNLDRMNRIDDDIERLADKTDDLVNGINVRLRVLEKKQYAIYAIAGVVGMTASYLSKFIRF